MLLGLTSQKVKSNVSRNISSELVITESDMVQLQKEVKKKKNLLNQEYKIYIQIDIPTMTTPRGSASPESVASLNACHLLP